MLLFVADNLAYFPYQSQEEPLFIMHHIDITLSVSGSNLLQTFKEVNVLKCLCLTVCAAHFSTDCFVILCQCVIQLYEEAVFEGWDSANSQPRCERSKTLMHRRHLRRSIISTASKNGPFNFKGQKVENSPEKCKYDCVKKFM